MDIEKFHFDSFGVEDILLELYGRFECFLKIYRIYNYNSIICFIQLWLNYYSIIFVITFSKVMFLLKTNASSLDKKYFWLVLKKKTGKIIEKMLARKWFFLTYKEYHKINTKIEISAIVDTNNQERYSAKYVKNILYIQYTYNVLLKKTVDSSSNIFWRKKYLNFKKNNASKSIENYKPSIDLVNNKLIQMKQNNSFCKYFWKWKSSLVTKITTTRQEKQEKCEKKSFS